MVNSYRSFEAQHLEPGMRFRPNNVGIYSVPEGTVVTVLRVKTRKGRTSIVTNLRSYTIRDKQMVHIE